MKRILAAIMVTGLLAGMADATPARSLAKRRVEKKRDAQETTAVTQAQAPPAAQAPAAKPVPAGPSSLSREGKPPSRRFFSRVRTDSSRDKAKAAKEAAAESTAAMQSTEKQKLIYRRTWGPRAHRRPR
jgi:hypothetical protein